MVAAQLLQAVCHDSMSNDLIAARGLMSTRMGATFAVQSTQDDSGSLIVQHTDRPLSPLILLRETQNMFRWEGQH